MIKIIDGKNVNDVYAEGLHWMRATGVEEDTRNGKALVSPWPVMSIYHRPWERVLFDARRNANPFFHLAEAVWMLAGSNDAQWIATYNKQMLAYSDNNKTLRGAYGYRWRHQWQDQISMVIYILKKDPLTRRAVISMWDVEQDLCTDGKDVPCNTTIYFRCNAGNLDMTVCCRSNDLVWGAYGANAVHFSILHEYIARACDMPQGKMYQLSNNFHIYEPHWHLMQPTPMVTVDPYETTLPKLLRQDSIRVTPLFKHPHFAQDFIRECEYIVDGKWDKIELKFLRLIVVPMLRAWSCRDGEESGEFLAAMPDCDWKEAAIQWLNRRNERVRRTETTEAEQPGP
jgi:thymidylate synthase